MATVIETPKLAVRDERFFFVMACAMAAVIVGGFSFNLAAGRSSFALPPIFHVHAFVFFGWVALYLVQNGLVFAGNVALHRSLGWLAVVWIPVMVVLAFTLTIMSVQHSAPFFFDANEFLFGNPIGILYFAAAASAAIALRRRTDWHRRLMFCAMASLTGPGFGRLLPMPLLIPWAWWVASFAFPTLFPLIGLIRDMRRSGRAHPAWIWGIAGLFGALLVGDLIAYSPIGYAITHQLIDGTPGAERGMKAHFPS